MENMKSAVKYIDDITLNQSMAKGLGKTAQQLKDKVTSQYQWLVADLVWNGKALSGLLNFWMDNSELVGEPRRTAKDGLTNAVKAWGEGDIQVQMNERTVGKKLKGVHIHYMNDAERDKAEYEASIKAMVQAIKKHGSALYDAFAILEMERQESNGKTEDTSISTKQLDKIRIENLTARQAEQIAEKKKDFLQGLI